MKTKWWILLIAVAFSGGLLTNCNRSEGLISSGLSFLFNSRNKEVVRDTIVIRDTIYIPYKVVVDTCLLMNKLKNLSKREIRRLPKEIKKELEHWNTIVITRDSINADTMPIVKSLQQALNDLDTLLPTPKVDLSKYYQESVFYETPMNCDTPDRFNKMKRNSKHNLSAVMTIDSEGYYSGGLSYQTRSRWSFGFFLSSRKVNGLIIQIPIRRYD